MYRLIDTHAHLSDLQDREGVIRRAKSAGLEAIIAVGANLEKCRATLEWANDFTGYVYPALGIHPTEWSGDEIPVTLAFIEEHIDDCIAVGEIGLDYWNRDARKNRGIREKQRNQYTDQLKIAENHGKPVSVHGRGSWEDALSIARKHGPDRIVFHWYSGPLDTLRELLDAGYLISATPASEFSKQHRAALAETPLERIVVETDSPVSYHGKLAEPADILLTLEALAELKGISEEELAEVTTRNAERLFNI
ncbi:MAG: TatD family hydrolase [Candidatus Bathyarchaeota archaeon]|nr:MAG: TatD family hydrolase [Candidatus Bathyarchaeota archaeon]